MLVEYKMTLKKQIYCSRSLVEGNKPLIRQNTLQIYYFPLTRLIIEEHSSTMMKEENKLKLKLMTDTQTHTQIGKKKRRKQS